MKITEEEKPVEQQVNIFEILADFQEKYRNVEACEIKGNYYVYRALGRKEYRELLNQKGINVFDKEEVLCESCLLYPDGAKSPALKTSSTKSGLTSLSVNFLILLLS